jgi:cytochrome c oxidase cbb3-type subunit I/II
MKQLGVPYTDAEIASGVENAQAQAKVIAEDLVKQGVPAEVEDKELIALIAYLQRMGTDYGSLPVNK